MSTRTSLVDVLAPNAGGTRTQPQQWLLEHLVRAGHLTSDGVSRRARLRACPRCGAVTLAGLDGNLAALEAWCDPVPLATLGEMLATLEGRETYELRRTGGRWEINPRDAGRIAHTPAGTGERLDVIRAHRCRSRSPSPPETAPTAFVEAKPLAPPGSPPPF